MAHRRVGLEPSPRKAGVTFGPTPAYANAQGHAQARGGIRVGAGAGAGAGSGSQQHTSPRTRNYVKPPLLRTASGHARGGQVALNRLLNLFELDYVLPGRAHDVAVLIGSHLARHLQCDIGRLKLSHQDTESGMTPRYTSLRTSQIQALYDPKRGHSAKITVVASFVVDRWGHGSVSFVLQRLTGADKEVVDDEAAYSTNVFEAHAPASEALWVRLYRCAHPDVCMVFRKPLEIAQQSASVVRRLSYQQLQARFCNIFWTVYQATTGVEAQLGEVVTLPGDLMAAINPSRMDVPFSILLSESDVLDESVIVSAIWEAALDVRQHASFPAWYDGRKPFNVVRGYALPLYNDPAHAIPGDVPEASEHAVRLEDVFRPSDQEMRDKQARILAGAPFLILLQCQAKTEMHITQLFAVPQPQKMNERQRVYRVCKVDCGHNIAQADNLWNIDSATDVLEELQERLVAEMSSGPLGLAQHLTGGAQSNPETKLRLQQVKEGIHMGQVLSQRCVLESMRDVGLEVWEGSDLVPGQRWANYVLLTAPLSTLAARAELMKMRVTVNPMHGDDDFVNNFESKHFLRRAPRQRYTVATKNKPHRYPNYFADFTLYQRLELIMDLLTRERAQAPAHNLALLRNGGADLNPLELVAEGVLEHFFPMHIPRQLHRLNAFWARLPPSLTRYERERDHALHLALQRHVSYHRKVSSMGAGADAKVGSPSMLALHDAHERGIHRGLSIHEVAMRAEGDVDDHGIYVRYSRNASDNPIGLGSSNRQLAIGDTVVISDEIAIAGDVAGAMYSEETGLALKPLVRPKKRPRCCRGCLGSVWYTITVEPQPLTAVFEYFGPTVAFYFLWLEFYTRALITPCLLGAGVELVSAVLDVEQEVVNGVKLDHLVIFGYSLGVMIWSSLCLEFFQLQQSKRAYMWDVKGLQSSDREPMRPGFISAMQRLAITTNQQTEWLNEVFKCEDKANSTNASANRPITQQDVAAWKKKHSKTDRLQKQLRRDLEVYNELYYFPPRLRHKAYTTSILVSTLAVLIVAASVLVTLVLPEILFGEQMLFGVQIASSLSGIAQGVIIPILNAAFRWVATWLTEREHHRYESQHVNSLIVKLFAFQFVNSYGSLFYIGFWLRDMQKLGSQLVGIMVTGQLIRIGKEHVLGILLRRVHHRKSEERDRMLVDAIVSSRKAAHTAHAKREGSRGWGSVRDFITTGASDDQTLTFGERSLLLLRRAISEHQRPDTPQLLDEYLQLVVQFGFVAMFCAAFPLAAAAAFVTNLIEMRLDAHKFLTSQRPLPQAANGIGVWFPIMQLLSTFAVVTNIVWIYLSTSEEDSTGNFSSSLEKLLPSLGQVGPVVGAFALEHLLILVKWAVRLVTPDTPSETQEDAFRERYFLLKEAEYAQNEMGEGNNSGAAYVGVVEDDDAAAELMQDIMEGRDDHVSASDTDEDDAKEGGLIGIGGLKRLGRLGSTAKGDDDAKKVEHSVVVVSLNKRRGEL